MVNGGGESTASDEERDASRAVTRRSFLRVAGATGAAGATTARGAGPQIGAASAQAGTPTETLSGPLRFGGEVIAWNGRAPAAIEGEQNPTLRLQAGQEYEVIWENIDGQPHNFTLQNDAEENLASTETMSEQGATRSLTFTATPAMTTYICTIHPTTMIGDVEVVGEAPAEGEGDGGGLPVWALLLVGGVALAFLSPILFALFLFSRGGGGATGGGETTGR